MDAVRPGRRMRLFRATDAFAVEAFQLTRAFGGAGSAALAAEIRRAAARSGSALLAASVVEAGSPAERSHLERARDHLVAGRYCVYLARRLGMLDARRYRALTARQDAALRELAELLGPPGAGRRSDPAAGLLAESARGHGSC